MCACLPGYLIRLNRSFCRCEAGLYFYFVAQLLAPYILASYGYHGVLQWRSKGQIPGSKADLTVTYNGVAALVLDFKGPNCIREQKLKSFGASSVSSAKAKLPPKANSLLSLAAENERALVLRGVQYAKETRAPYILFYDYDFIFAMEPTQELVSKKSGVLLDVVLFQEPAKSTRSQLVTLDENHVSMLLKYIVKGVARVAG